MQSRPGCCRRLAAATQRLLLVCIASTDRHRLRAARALSQQQQHGWKNMNKRHNNTEEFYKSHRRFPALFGDTFQKSWLHDDMLELVKVFERAVGEDDDPENDPIRNASSVGVLRVEAPDVYSFRCLSGSFLSMFLEEIRNFYRISDEYGLDIRRPNSMNNYGVIVNEIGMRSLITSFQQTWLWPVARLLFPREGSRFDDHHSFIVRYTASEDLGLDMHTDDSDVTFNVCLGEPGFTGATLSFCGTMGEPDHRSGLVRTYSHEIGRAVVHLGNRRHGADDIDSGTRSNLIVWNHNFAWRASPEYRRRRTTRLYRKEQGPPHPTCLSYTHDRDYAAYKDFPSHTKGMRLRGWCPPEGYEYDGFPDLSSAAASRSSSREDKEL